jgi:hypothetical protein
MNRTNRVLLGIAIAVVIILLLSWANGRMAKRQAETVEDVAVAASLCDELLVEEPEDDAAGTDAERSSMPTGPVEGVTLYRGAPDARTPLARQNTGDTLNYWVWALPEEPEGEYWIECSWEGGKVTRSRRLPREVRECKVGLDRDSAAAGLYAIRGVACR